MASRGTRGGGGGGASFNIVYDTLTFGILRLGAGLDDEVESVLGGLAEEIQQAAQDNAPWADRTGDARAGLSAEVVHDGHDFTIELSHSVDYGQWLETIQSGRFAIIMPTLEQYSQKVFDAVGAERTGGG
jgi:hypothetical protein